jgi:hypothetical protein
MVKTIWTLGDAVRRFPLMRVDCSTVGFFNTMDVARRPTSNAIPFRCGECGPEGLPKVQLLEVDVDRLPKVGVWRPMKVGRNQPTVWSLQRLK